jgi:hypothetical protein
MGVAVVFYGLAIKELDHVPRPAEKDLLSVAIPAPVQVVLSGGDRFLAANTAVFRALVVGTGQLDAETYRILGRVQSDAAQLNPLHEDNYYISQAILPWNGEVEADLIVQKAATETRTWDPLPPFFLGFDQYYFLKDPRAGAKSVEIAARRSPPANRDYLTTTAAHWYEKGDDPRVAIGMIKAMVASTRDKDLKKHLELRIDRLQGLASLRDMVTEFAEKKGRPPKRLDELIEAGLIVKLPVDPLGQGYTLDAKGVPIIAQPKSAKR